MKKVMIAVATLCLCCGLCACEKTARPETQPDIAQSTTEPVKESQTPTEVALTPEGYYVDSYTRRDGATVTKHRVGSKQGRLVWEKCENPDGSGYEKTYDEQGVQIKECKITVNYYGLVKKTYWICAQNAGEDDWLEGIAEYAADGSYYEQWYWQNGKGLKKSITGEPAIGKKTHWEFYENGVVQYQLIETEEYTEQIQQDEEGYCTYYAYTDTEGYTVECVADETGKLIKCILMGEEAEDLARWAEEYHFRSW